MHDLNFALPVDIAAPIRQSSVLRPQIPTSLIRQELSSQGSIEIPKEILRLYQQWRPTLLRRARLFEREINTNCRLYYKYEGANVSGSHKLNTAVAQAYYYRRAGARRLTAGTGAGQWGTALAAACAMVGLDCTVFMVRSSYQEKPYRKTIMEMLGATVIPSPRGQPGDPGSLSVALGEALSDANDPGTYFCAGSGETYSLLHQTVIGLEAREQLSAFGDPPDIVVASLGGGSNLGGLALPFLGAVLRAERPDLRILAVEPAACPKLTRGRYAYDFTDASGLAPLQKMYTLGHSYRPPPLHAGGLRYHGTAKLVSSLYNRGLIEAAAYPQRDVFSSAVRFAKAEGILPAPESAHAIHGAAVEARRADEQGRSLALLVGISGHGHFDMGAYASYLDGSMVDAVASNEDIARGLAHLPPQPDDSYRSRR